MNIGSLQSMLPSRARSFATAIAMAATNAACAPALVFSPATRAARRAASTMFTLVATRLSNQAPRRAFPKIAPNTAMVAG
jgi:hypothetical protein